MGAVGTVVEETRGVEREATQGKGTRRCLAMRRWRRRRTWRECHWRNRRIPLTRTKAGTSADCQRAERDEWRCGCGRDGSWFEAGNDANRSGTGNCNYSCWGSRHMHMLDIRGTQAERHRTTHPGHRETTKARLKKQDTRKGKRQQDGYNRLRKESQTERQRLTIKQNKKRTKSDQVRNRRTIQTKCKREYTETETQREEKL